MSQPSADSKNCQVVVEKESRIRRHFYRLFPIATWIGKYKWDYLRFDLIAGIIVGVTIFPQCLAAGSMTGVKPHNGLAATFIAQLIYIMIGSAKDSSIGPSPIIAVIVGEFNAQHNPLYALADSTYTTLLSFIIGIILTVWGALQLTYLYNLFSIPVVSGFMTAAGFAVPCSQLRNYFGLPKNPMVPPGVLVKQVKNVFDNWHHIKPLDLAFGLPSLTYIILVQRLPLLVDMIATKCLKNKGPIAAFLKKPKVQRAIILIAASRNVVVFMVTTGVSYHLQTAYEPGTFQYTIVGRNHTVGLPELKVPKFYQVHNESEPPEGANLVHGPGDIFEALTIGFVVIPWVMALEMIMGLKALSRKNGYKIDPMQEMMAIGIGNFFQSFIGGIPSTNAAPRMALMDQLKSKSPLASFFAGCTALLFIGVGSEFFVYSPRPPIAAVIMAAGINFIDFSIAKLMWKEYPKDVIVYTFTFLTCFFYDMTYGLLTSFLFQLCLYLTPAIKMHLRVSRVPIGMDQQTEQQLPSALIIKLPIGLKYPNTDKLCDRLERAMLNNNDATHVVVDCKLVTGTDYTGIQCFRRILVMAIKHRKNLVFSNLNESMRRKLEDIGLENFRCAASVDEAISEYNKVQWVAQQASVLEQMKASAQQPAVSRLPMSTTEQLEQQKDVELQLEETEQVERSIQRRLSKQPNFYEDIPMAVGHGGDDDDEDDDRNVEVNRNGKRIRKPRPSESSHHRHHHKDKNQSTAPAGINDGGDRIDVVAADDGGQEDENDDEDDDKASVSTYQFVASDLSDSHLPPSTSNSKRGSRRSSSARNNGSGSPTTGSCSRPLTPAAVAKFLRRFSREHTEV